MSDNRIEANDELKDSVNESAVRTPSARERLSRAADMIKEADKSVSDSRIQRSKILDQNEEQKEERIRESYEKIADSQEKARRIAEQNAPVDRSYKSEFDEREKRRSEQARQRRAEEEEERRIKREQVMAEYRESERREIEERRRRAAEFMQSLKADSVAEQSDTEVAAEAKDEDISADEFFATPISQNTNTADRGEEKKEYTPIKQEAAPRLDKTENASNANKEAEFERSAYLEAEKRHLRKVREAIDAAKGRKEEERRLLQEEERRYISEVARIATGQGGTFEPAMGAGQYEPLSSIPRASYRKEGEEYTSGVDYTRQGYPLGYVSSYPDPESPELEYTPIGYSAPIRGAVNMPHYPDPEPVDEEYTPIGYVPRANVPTYPPADGYTGYTPTGRPPFDAYGKITPDLPHEFDTGGDIKPEPELSIDDFALAEYEKLMAMRNARKEGESEPYRDRDFGGEYPSEPYVGGLEIPERDERSLDYGDDSIHEHYSRIELARFLTRSYRQREEIMRADRKLERKCLKAAGDERINLVVDRIKLSEQLIRICAEEVILCASCTDSAKKDLAKAKRSLLREIIGYNRLADEYDAYTGIRLQRLSEDMISDIARGAPCPELPEVYHVGDEPFDSRYISPRDRREMEREKLRLARENKRRARKGLAPIPGDGIVESDADRVSAEKSRMIKRELARDEAVISARSEYNVARLENEINKLLYSFAAKDDKRRRQLRDVEVRQRRLRRLAAKALRCEKKDNERFYYLLTHSREETVLRKRARKERLEALVMRLEVLLTERARINERLLSLYGYDPSGKSASLKKKESSIQKKHAKAAYKKQRRMASRLEKMHVPLDIKDKVYALMNKKTEIITHSEIARSRLKRDVYRGRARGELVREVRGARRSIRAIDKEIAFLMKKAKRHDQEHKSSISQGIWIIGVLVAAVVVYLLWHYLGA